MDYIHHKSISFQIGCYSTSMFEVNGNGTKNLTMKYQYKDSRNYD